jgi:hypothetical protein
MTASDGIIDEGESLDFSCMNVSYRRLGLAFDR